MAIAGKSTASGRPFVETYVFGLSDPRRFCDLEGSTVMNPNNNFSWQNVAAVNNDVKGFRYTGTPLLLHATHLSETLHLPNFEDGLTGTFAGNQCFLIGRWVTPSRCLGAVNGRGGASGATAGHRHIQECKDQSCRDSWINDFKPDGKGSFL